MLQTILVATDLSSRSALALSRARMLADINGARLSVLHVLDDVNDQPDRSGHTDDHTKLTQHVESVLDGTAELDIRLHVGDPFEEILGIAAESDADLIVIGAPRRRRLLDFFTGTTAERVIRRSTTPVLTVHAAPQRPWRKILCAFDASDSATNALRIANSHGLLCNTTVTLLHVIDPLAQMGMATRGARHDVIAGHRDEEAARIAGAGKTVIEDLGLQAIARFMSTDGNAASVIVEQASSGDFDLVIVGTHGSSRLKHFFLGSVASRVLAEAIVDVLAVPFNSRAV